MKILCVSDHIDPLVYSTSIKKRFADVELVLSAGDLPLSYYDFIMSTLNKPLLFVFGNHNLRFMSLYTGVDAFGRGHPAGQGSIDYPPTGATYIGFRTRREKSLLVAGLGGSLWYNGGANQYKEFQVVLRILKLLRRPRHREHDRVVAWYRAEQARTLAKTFVTRFAAGFEKVFLGMPYDWDRSLAALAGPNPFRSRLRLTLSGSPGDGAKVQVFDAQGRLVRALFRGVLTEGERLVVWDGLDHSGRPAASGFYLVRAVSRERHAVRRVVRLR